MSEKRINIEDIITVTTLESQTRIMTLKNGLLAKGKEAPVINLVTNNPDVYDMACESLMKFYMANKPAVKDTTIVTVVDMANAFQTTHSSELAKKDEPAQTAPTPAINAGNIKYAW